MTSKKPKNDCLIRGATESSNVAVLKPMFAPQPGEDGNQDAHDDEEAERNHPYPQPIPFALFLQPRLPISPPKRSVSTSCFVRARRIGVGKGGEGVRVSELWPG